MTQIRKPLTTFLVGLLLGLLMALGIAQLSHKLAGTQAGPVTHQTQTQPAAAMRQIELPDPNFTALVLGYGVDFDPLEAERLGSIAVDVCTQLTKGFTYASIRAGLEEVYGFSHGEAGLLISATRLYECQ